MAWVYTFAKCFVRSMEDFSGYITHRAEVPAWNLILLHESGNSGRFKKITAIVFVVILPIYLG